MRKYDIDNLRWISILLLFPYHIFTIYNNWGENYYIKGSESFFLSVFVKLCQPWFMPLLFVLAGESAIYALEKRTSLQYLKERVLKLFIPFLSSLFLLIPILTYFAEKFHNGYTGNYLEQYILFFTKETDFVGYTGGFTPAHLWFLIYLFLVSIISLPFLLLFKKYMKKILKNLPFIILILLFFIVWLCSYILDINGKSIGRFFSLFLLGSCVISQEVIQKKLENNKWKLCIIYILLILFYFSVDFSAILNIILFHLISWIGVLTWIGLSRYYLNFNNKITSYFKKASFSIYIFHLPWIIVIGYYSFKITSFVYLQVIIMLLGSLFFTFLTYEIIKRVSFLKILFGIK